MFRDKFWLSFALTIPVVFGSSYVQHWLGYTATSFQGSNLIPAILGTVIFFYFSQIFRPCNKMNETQAGLDLKCYPRTQLHDGDTVPDYGLANRKSFQARSQLRGHWQ
jgi:hypothetical protein